MSRLRLLFLGSPRVEYEGQPVELGRRKSLALLCYLVEAQPYCSREILAAMFWPECDDKRARAGLRQALFSLSETPVGQWLETDRETVSVRHEYLWVDTIRFNTLLAGEPTLEKLSEAVNLYRDHFLAGFTLRDSAEFDNWQSLQIQVYQQKLVSALEQLVNLQIAAHNPEKAIEFVQRWLQIDVLHEPAQRQFMRLCAAIGQRAAALRQYEIYVDMLKRELGILPSVEMVRLYEAIKKNEPITLAAHSAPIRSALPMLPGLVVGRETALRELKTHLLKIAHGTEHHASVTAIQGWPGIGKTTMAALLAHDEDLHEHFHDGVLFASLGEQPNLFAELLNWANALGIDSAKFDSIEAVSRHLTAVLRDKRMLLIVDDVWETAHAAPFNIGGQECALVITTRMNDIAQALAGSPDYIYKLPILTEARAVDLLRTLAPRVVAENPQALQQLAQNLEGLPLALQVAGRLLNAEISLGWGVTDLLLELQEGVTLLEAETPQNTAEFDSEAPPTVRVLLKRSTDRLSPELRQCFALLGVFAPKPATFDLDAIRAVWQMPDPKAAVRTLVARGLLEPVDAGRFQMHALLVLHAKSMFEG